MVCSWVPEVQFRSPVIENDRAGELLAKLKECGRSRDLNRVREIHLEACEAGGGSISHLYIANSLIDVYGHCGSMNLARSVFDAMLQRDVVSWNALLQGYARNGQSQRVIEAFHSMSNCIPPDARTFVVVLSACGAMASIKHRGSERRRWLEQAKLVHSLVISSDCSNIYVENTLIDVYAKFGEMRGARLVLDSMEQPDTVSWNALLQGYVENGESERALELFGELREPNSRTFIAALLACASSAEEEVKKSGKPERRHRWLEQGRRIHSRALELGLRTLFLESVLVDMYSRCGSVADARMVFEKMARRDVVSWTALMQGYVENGESEVALEIFDRGGEYGCSPNSRSFTVALSACAALAGGENRSSGRWLEKGRRIYSRAVHQKCSNVFVESSMVDLCSKSGAMGEARVIFDRMRTRDSVAWNALVMGYVSNGENELALELVSVMDVPRNSSTYVAALVACTNLMAAESGRVFHEEVKSLGLEKDVMISNCLIDFYGKCGDIKLAKLVFDGMSRRTVVSWTSLMSGYSLQGDTEQVFELFRKMKEVDDIAPCGITFVCLLAACSHAGLTERGKEVFDSMEKKFGVAPGIKHYTCLVDLYCRANSLDEALGIVRTMPFEADHVTWKAILGACHRWGNVAVGEAAFRALLELRKDDEGEYEDDASVYVLMGGIYRKAGMNKEFAEVVFRSEMIQKQSSTTRWTDDQNKVHKFTSKA